MDRQRRIIFGILLGTIVAVVGSLKIIVFWPSGELDALHDNIVRQVDLIETGQSVKIDFRTNYDAILILSQAYNKISDVGNDIDANLLGQMQYEVNSSETGHIFLIRQRKIIDHRLLYVQAEIILAKAQGKEFAFTISKIERPNNPIIIEMKSR